MLTVTRAEDATHLFAAASFVDRHHSYIRWADRPSRKLYWSVWDGDRRVGVWGLGSAFNQPKAVATFMERHGIPFNGLANNIVFALADAGKNGGTEALAMLRRDAIRWWHERYGDDLMAFQTFILPPRTGAMYRADNWQHVGTTTGDGMETQTLAAGEPVPDGWSLRLYGGKRFARRHVPVEKKDIYMRLVSKKERRQAMAGAMTPRQAVLL